MPEKGMQHHLTTNAQEPNEFAAKAIEEIMSGKDVVIVGSMSLSSRTLWMMPKKASAHISYKTMQEFMGKM